MIWCNVFKCLWKKPSLVSVIVRTASKGSSSSRWLRRQHATLDVEENGYSILAVKDLYVKKALKDSYRCRSAYKLIELDDKFHFLQPGRVVIDCGASPGSWTQVAVERVVSTKPGYDVIPGFVIAVDLLDIKDIPGATVLSRSDFTNADTQRKIKVLIPDCGADVIMSDMAPNATGSHTMNHEAVLDLCQSAFGFGKTVLKPGGVFLCKLWDGYGTRDFLAQIQKDFKFVKECKPRASRRESAELYIYAENFRKEDNSR